MKNFIIVVNDAESRYFFQIDGAFSIEIDAPGANFFIVIGNEDGKELDIEIPYEIEDCYLPYMMEYEDGFFDAAFQLMYDEAEKIIVEFLKSDKDYFSGDLLKSHLSIKLTELCKQYATKYFASFEKMTERTAKLKKQKTILSYPNNSE